jgi:hypothetical protein
MIGKRVERCNESRNGVLRFDGKLIRFSIIGMKKPMYHIEIFRQSLTSRWITIIVLWITMITSIPSTDVNAAFAASHVHRILPSDPIPVASPGHLNKTTPEYAEFSTVIINTADLEEHLHTYLPFELRSLEHAHLLTSALIYTQTTSSYL